MSPQARPLAMEPDETVVRHVFLSFARPSVLQTVVLCRMNPTV